LSTVVKKQRPGLADSFTEGPDGTIFATSSRIQDSTWFKPEQGTVLAAPGESAAERIHLGPDLQRQGTGQGSVSSSRFSYLRSLCGFA
jgi:hypothetical protein